MNKDFKNKLFFEALNITLTNVVSISYKNKASLDDFIKMYQKIVQNFILMLKC